jgi:flagellar hook-length control protein FliK
MSSVGDSTSGSSGASSAASAESARAESARAEAAQAEAAKAAEAAKQAEEAKQAEDAAKAAAQAVQNALAADTFTAAPTAPAPVELNPAPTQGLFSSTPMAQQASLQAPSFTAASLQNTTLGQPTTFQGTLSTQGLVAGATRFESPAAKAAWGGAQAAAQRAKDIGLEMGFTVSSEKRSKTSSIGSTPHSDHHVSQKQAFALDFPATGARGTALAQAISKAYGFPEQALGTYHKHNFQFEDNTYRMQVLWEVKGHYDHVHVGVRRVE